MTVKDILVHVDTSPSCEGRLRLAAHLAHRFDAHLFGVGLAEETAAEDQFAGMLRDDGLVGEWLGVTGSIATYLTHRARTADLVVMSKRDPARGNPLDPADVILGCARPVLVLPRDAPARRIGDIALVAWNGSREAARAVGEALPLLSASARVVTVSVNPDADEDWHLDDGLVPHLVRHGLKATGETITTDLAPSDALMTKAADLGADLIVAGAYGHARLREMILGGVTHDLLDEATLPVLMAH